VPWVTLLKTLARGFFQGTQAQPFSKKVVSIYRYLKNPRAMGYLIKDIATWIFSGHPHNLWVTPYKSSTGFN